MPFILTNFIDLKKICNQKHSLTCMALAEVAKYLKSDEDIYHWRK